MINQQAITPNNMERMSMMRDDKTTVVKVDVKKSTNKDLTQTKEFWSNLAVLS